MRVCVCVRAFVRVLWRAWNLLWQQWGSTCIEIVSVTVHARWRLSCLRIIYVPRSLACARCCGAVVGGLSYLLGVGWGAFSFLLGVGRVRSIHVLVLCLVSYLARSGSWFHGGIYRCQGSTWTSKQDYFDGVFFLIILTVGL